MSAITGQCCDLPQRRLISQEVVTGKELWTKDIGVWIAEVGECVLGSNCPGALLRLVVHLACSDEATCSWEAATKLLARPIAPALMASQLVRIGFSVNQCQFMLEGEESLVTEYRTILRLGSLPVKMLLKIIEHKLREIL